MNPIGHSSPAFCWDPIEDTLERVAGDGFDVWEIVGEGGHDPWKHRRAFGHAFASYDVKPQLHAPISDCNLGSLVESARRNAVRLVTNAIKGGASFGVECVTIHPGNHSPLSRGQYARLHEATRRSLRELAPLGEEYGVQLCLENVPLTWAFETETMEKLRDLTRDTGFWYTFDYGHAHVVNRLPEFEKAAKDFGNVHVHDNKGDVDAHLTLGAGTLPWQRVTKRLVASGFSGAFVIESNGQDSGVQSLQKLRGYLRRLDD